ncbi:MGDG synthase family glycosyltransferase [Oceanobacillus sp. CF4.6]|uniref:MGDG synthase family glycosyltransferase n=1 Tax=Oceanobacillus sp. CF4.6 TaxID=3373080 RepID=UPI003EE5F032
MVHILFMPLLQIPSGHHHVADCIQDQLNEASEEFHCEKMELLSYSFGPVEKLVSSFYLQWIQKFPSLYSNVYQRMAVKQEKHNKHYYIYELLFLKHVQRMIAQTKPDLIICTHALPSYLLDRLKRRNLWTGKVLNVYTDYFINDLWGFDHINYHFIPTIDVQRKLIERGVDQQQTILTGIPVHPVFRTNKPPDIVKEKYTVLISGGNMGAGSIEKLLDRLQPSGTINYHVLCGKNNKLYQSIKQRNHSCIHALPYIHSKEEMNTLYDQADAIITKPGGVTISESLWKRLPIFVYEALPGQEEINLNYLNSQGLIFHLDNWNTSIAVESTIIERLQTESAQLHENLEAYFKPIEKQNITQIIQKLI